jgi:hypothetical protein
MLRAFPSRTFLVHVTQHEGRTLERLLAPRDPGVDSLVLEGAIVEASYARKDPALLARLGEGRIPWAMDPQSVRFSSPRPTGPTAALPYAPSGPLDPSRMTSQVKAMVREALMYQAAAEPAMYMVPSLPLVRSSQAVFRTFAGIHNFAADLNGSTDVPYRPMLATAFPGASVLRDRYSLFERLDRTFAGAYVLPLQLDPKRDSVERLVAYARFLENAQSLGMPVIAGRAGVFGLVLAAFGISNFDSGLGERESFSLARLSYERKTRPDGSRNGGRQRRVYVWQLRTIVPAQAFEELLAIKGIQGQLMCDMGECRYGGIRYPLENPREHFMHARAWELAELRNAKTTAMRVQLVSDWLRTAAERARLINRLRGELGQPSLDFEHLESWRAVLARIATPIAVSGS